MQSSVFLFVVNPVSGGSEKRDLMNAIKEFFASLPHVIELFVLTGKNDAPQIDNLISRLKPATVVAVGGDGTVTLVAKRILGTGIKLGILPAGSANGMAAELNIPINTDDALKILIKNVSKQMDVLSVNGLLCLHLSDLGLNARLVKYFERGNMRGKLGYAIVALKVLLRKQSVQVTIRTSEKEITLKAFMVAIANASKYGTGIMINPEGDLYDGKFEVVIIKNVGLRTLFKMWLRPRALADDKIEVIQADRIQITAKKRMHFQVDGEYIGKVNKLSGKVLTEKLNIIMP